MKSPKDILDLSFDFRNFVIFSEIVEWAFLFSHFISLNVML